MQADKKTTPYAVDPAEVTSPAIEKLESEAAALRDSMDGAAGSGDYKAADKAKRDLAKLEARIARERASAAKREAKRRDREAKKADKAARAASRRPMGRRGRRPEEGPGPDDAPPEYERDANASQRLMAYDLLFRDGIMRVDKGRYSACAVFDDIAYSSALVARQQDVRHAWRDFLNSLATGQHAPRMQLVLRSRSIDRGEMVERLMMPTCPGDEALDRYRDEFDAYVGSKLASSAKSMRHERCAVFTVDASDHDDAARQLAGVLDRWGRFCRSLESRSRVLSGQERLTQLASYTRPDDAPDKFRFDDLASTPGLTTRDLCAPWRVMRCREWRGDPRMYVGGRWVRSYSVLADGYGNTMSDSWLADLSSLPHDLTISLHIRPWAPEDAVSAAARHYSDVSDENSSYKQRRSHPERGFFVDDSNMPRAMLDAERGAAQVRDELVNGDQSMFALVTVVMVSARTLEGLDEACRDVEAVFSAQSKPGAESWFALREQSFSSALPIGNCLVPYERNVLSKPLSALVPFLSFDVQDEGGLLLGVNSETRNFAMLDRPARDLTNGFIMGLPRMGKSVLVKLLAEQVRLRGPLNRQFIIDPEGEYPAMVEALGGQVIDLSDSSADHFNPFDISRFYGSADPDKPSNPLPSKVSFIQSFLSVMVRNISDPQKALVDRICGQMYSRWLQTDDPADIPTLQTFYDRLRQVEGASADDAQELADLIERFVTGTLSYFNHQTNVDTDSNLIDFVLVDMSPELKPLAMMCLLDWMWVQVTANRAAGVQTWLWIDELQLLLDDVESVRQFDRFWSRGGKWGMFNTGITQTPDRLIELQTTKYMLQNSRFLALTKQDSGVARSLAELLGLSDDQEMVLRTADVGEGVYVIDKKAMQYSFRIDPELMPDTYALATSRPHEVLAARARRQELAEALARPREAEGAASSPWGEADDLDEPDGLASAPEPVARPFAWGGAAGEAAAAGDGPEEAPDGEGPLAPPQGQAGPAAGGFFDQYASKEKVG